jgi:hypothetical protein
MYYHPLVEQQQGSCNAVQLLLWLLLWLLQSVPTALATQGAAQAAYCSVRFCWVVKTIQLINNQDRWSKHIR